MTIASSVVNRGEGRRARRLGGSRGGGCGGSAFEIQRVSLDRSRREGGRRTKGVSMWVAVK